MVDRPGIRDEANSVHAGRADAARIMYRSDIMRGQQNPNQLPGWHQVYLQANTVPLLLENRREPNPPAPKILLWK